MFCQLLTILTFAVLLSHTNFSPNAYSNEPIFIGSNGKFNCVFDITIIQNFFLPCPITDSKYVFIFREAVSPFLYENMSGFGLSREWLICHRLGLLCLLICSALFRSGSFVSLIKFALYRLRKSSVRNRRIISRRRKRLRFRLKIEMLSLSLSLLFICGVLHSHKSVCLSPSYSLVYKRHRYPSKKKLHRRQLYSASVRNMYLVHVLVLPVILLLLRCGDVHPHPGPVLPRNCRHPDAQALNVASWNVRTLLDTKRSAGRPTAIVSRELGRYNIDIAALSETRILGDSIIPEDAGGYTFFLKGNPLDGKCYHGVGFAIRTKLVTCLEGKYPTGINERLMTMSLPLDDCTLSIISAYAPTLASSDESKEEFYGKLSEAIKSVPSSHKLLVMGDFNARVGRDFDSWENVIGKNGVGNENSNGTLLLSMCSQLELIITNTIFQQANRHKTTWMHPRTKQWHMLDYVITRQRDVRDVLHTRAMCGSCTWSDHRLVKCKLALRAKRPRHRARLKPVKKLNIAKLKLGQCRLTLASKLQEAYATENNYSLSAAQVWDTFKNCTVKVAGEVLGHPERKHRDWFDENDSLINPLLNRLHELHLQAIEDQHNNGKAAEYRACKQETQKSLRNMKNTWWKERAVVLQCAADKRDYKTFYQELKAVHGPKQKSSPSIKSKDGVLITEPDKVLDRWAEHFKGVLNQDSQFYEPILQDIPQLDENTGLDALPTLEEVLLSIKQLTSGKAAGKDGIPPDIYKHGGIALAEELLKLFKLIWEEGQVPQDFKDADLVHLYKNKGDSKCCDNHRGISLLCIAGKIFARLQLNRLNKHIEDIGLIPESQCGFRPGRGTTDMVFALRQIQEKCRLYSEDLYLLFIDLTKAFDTVNRPGLWAILEKIGCPKRFLGLIRSFHEGMYVTVREGSDRSKPFEVTSGTKQGCVLAPTLFSIFFSVMLHVAFKDATDGIDIKSRFDRNPGNVRTSHFSAPTKVKLSTVRDLLFADDCALAACTQEALQRLCDSFAAAARQFGLTISIKKTESLHQPAVGNMYVPPLISVEGKLLNAVESFKYLGGIISNCASIDAEINARITKATSAFGRLTKRLWQNKDIRLGTKVSVYKAAVLTSLLYGSETWTLNKKQTARLETFHQTCLRKIAKIRWFHKVTNYEVLSKCHISSLESMLDTARLRWIGHVVRMKNDRIPKALLYGRLATGASKCGKRSTYMNSVRSTLRACGIDCARLEDLASDRNQWRATVKAGIKKAEEGRIESLIEKRMRRGVRADLAHLPM